jgi:hypothetical protein
MLNNLKYGFQGLSFLVLFFIEIDRNEISNETRNSRNKL